jgi:hypothetical protein
MHHQSVRYEMPILYATYKVNNPSDQFDKEMITRFERAMIFLRQKNLTIDGQI